MAAGEKFFAEHAPRAAWIADGDAALNEAFERPKGSLWQLFGPRVWLHGLRALRRGHRLGKMGKDPLRMPGLFVVRGGRVLYRFDFTDAGAQPDLVAAKAASVTPAA